MNSKIEAYRGGQRGDWRDPLYASPFTGLWDPSANNNWDVGPYGQGHGGGDEASALAHAHVDWRETDTAHVFRADLPGWLAFHTHTHTHIYIYI